MGKYIVEASGGSSNEVRQTMPAETAFIEVSW